MAVSINGSGTITGVGNIESVPAADVDFIPSGNISSTTVQGALNDIAGNSGASKIGYTPAGTGAVTTTVQNKLRESVSVKDFGAVGDGVADDTNAFRLACMSVGAMTNDMAYRGIYVPPGRYKLTDTIYVRSGNVLYGSGMSTFIDASGFPGAGTSPVFKLGWGLVDGVPTKDTFVGDLPPEIYGMFVLGGPGAAAVVDLTFNGGLIHDMWFSAPGIGVTLSGGYLYDCVFDLGLNGVVVNGGVNQSIMNCRFFNQNYAISILDSATSDLLIEGCTIEYPKYIGLQSSPEASGSRGIIVSNCDFLTNFQYSTLVNSVYLDSDNLEIRFNGCKFSNTKGFAAFGDGSGLDVEFNGCQFDGDKTNPSYTQSTTAGGVKFQTGELKIQNCVFKNLRNYSLQFGTGDGTGVGHFVNNIIQGTGTVTTDINIVSVGLDTLYIANNSGSGIGLFNPNDACLLDVKNNQRWLGAATPASGRVGVLIPYSRATAFIASLTANFAPGSNANYRKNHMAAVDAYVEFDGVKLTSYLRFTKLRESPANTFAVLDVQYDLDSIGGGSSKTYRQSGYVCMSWPNTYANTSVNIDSYSGNL